MDTSVLSQYGLAGLVILVLAGVVVYQNKDNKALQKKIDDIQESRLQDARDTRDKIVEPLELAAKSSEAQGKLIEKIYELVLRSKQGE